MSATPLGIETDEQDIPEALMLTAPFSDLPKVVLKAVSEAAERRVYQADESVYSPGQFDGAEFLLVERGRLKAAYANPQNEAMLIEEIGPQQFFALAEAAAGGENLRADVVTLTADEDCRVIAFDAAAFRGVIARRPLLARKLMQYFAELLICAQLQTEPSELSAERRVFAALMEYVERDAISGAWKVQRMPKHRELGHKAGADEAATANAIARLIQDGVARRDYPGLIIDDIAQLNRLAS